jgi:predicted MPP superfamily phosphohydrolase
MSMLHRGTGDLNRVGVSRRRFLLSAGAFGGALAADAFALEPWRVRITRHDLPVAGLPAALEGLRIAQISDMHLPGNRRAARAAIACIGRERPEVVVLTGDICESEQSLGALTAFVREVRGTLGTFGIYGNWEHKARIAPGRLGDAYAAAGAELLVSRSASIERGGARLGIVGLDDGLYVAPDLARALERPPAEAEIWLVHCPVFADIVPASTPAPVALLAGHTHGGQVRFPGWTPYTPHGSGSYVSGWYRSGAGPLYVSRGVGTAIVEARLFCQPEIPVFTLRATTAGPLPDSRRSVPHRVA